MIYPSRQPWIASDCDAIWISSGPHFLCARQKLAAFNKNKTDARKIKGTKKPEQASLYKQLEAAIKAGKITKEQAREKLAAFNKTKAAAQAKKGATKTKQASLYKQIEAAVKAGEITKEQAREKLELTALSIEKIAWEVGYTDTGAFRKVFQKIVGLTPSDYRQRFGLAG